MRSADNANSKPPPTAIPCTAAITGLFIPRSSCSPRNLNAVVPDDGLTVRCRFEIHPAEKLVTSGANNTRARSHLGKHEGLSHFPACLEVDGVGLGSVQRYLYRPSCGLERLQPSYGSPFPAVREAHHRPLCFTSLFGSRYVYTSSSSSASWRLISLRS